MKSLDARLKKIEESLAFRQENVFVYWVSPQDEAKVETGLQPALANLPDVVTNSEN